MYDASARTPGSPSLNDCLQKSPKFSQLVFDILVCFRTFKVAITADLENAFLQIAVAEDDRDYLRFLWVKDAMQEGSDLQVLQFARIVFRLSPSPFLLNATIRHHLEKYVPSQPEIVSCLLKSIYVDDIVTGANSEEETFELYLQSKRIFHEASFNLWKFCTNVSSARD